MQIFKNGERCTPSKSFHRSHTQHPKVIRVNYTISVHSLSRVLRKKISMIAEARNNRERIGLSMRTYITAMFERMNLQQIREFLLTGTHQDTSADDIAEVHLEIGMKAGARLIYQLLLTDNPPAPLQG